MHCKACIHKKNDSYEPFFSNSLVGILSLEEYNEHRCHCTEQHACSSHREICLITCIWCRWSIRCRRCCWTIWCRCCWCVWCFNDIIYHCKGLCLAIVLYGEADIGSNRVTSWCRNFVNRILRTGYQTLNNMICTICCP